MRTIKYRNALYYHITWLARVTFYNAIVLYFNAAKRVGTVYADAESLNRCTGNKSKNLS